MNRRLVVSAALVLGFVVATTVWVSRGLTGEPRETPFDRVIKENATAQLEEGRRTFRFDTEVADVVEYLKSL